MAKDTFYFSHDYNARSDEKIKALIFKHSLRGYGIFWAIIEDLYNNANALRMDCERIAFELREDKTIVESVIKDFGLFVFEGEYFGSISVEKRLNDRNSKSLKARESANKRWSKCEGNANALPTQSEGNAIKERKGKENKGKEIGERKLKFASELEVFLPIYGRDLLNDFYKYWSESNISNTKFRKELEKTWETDLRLKTWASKDKSFAKKQEEKPVNYNKS